MSKLVWVSPDRREDGYFLGNDSSEHYMVMGITGKGRNPMLQAEADRLGISYEELERRLEPTDEQKERARIREQSKERKEEQRLQVVRQAIWDAWSEDENAFSRLYDELVLAVMKESCSRVQLKAVFMLLPAMIVGKGIAWGFDDIEVVGDMREFLEENKDIVVALLTAEQT